MPKKARASDPAPRTRNGKPEPVTVTRIPGRALAYELATALATGDRHVEVCEDGSVMVLNGPR